MGFLDHSTNNIILDAVLTDVGRQLLARNDNSFSIKKFALGDDEINYSIIKKYGRTVGREKIEKNTPIFEALTNQEHALKYKLNTVSNPNLNNLPRLQLSGGNVFDVDALVNTIKLSFGSTDFGGAFGNIGPRPSTSVSVTVEQTSYTQSNIEPELRDSVFTVDVPDMLCSISGNTPNMIDSQKRATYTIRRIDEQNSYGGSKTRFTIAAKSLTTSIFQIYGTPYGNSTYIRSYIRVTGLQSGSVLDINLDIYR
jgi:hypothetical protein